jgi:hypothetical protein
VSAHVCGDQSAGDVRDNFTKLKKFILENEQTFQVEKNSLGGNERGDWNLSSYRKSQVSCMPIMPSDEIVRPGLVRGEIPIYGGAGLAAALSKAMQREDER